ncbi:MAG: hypothetical protein Q8L05_08770 [Actinomycetota bacterium]|nr:hypothetical protein [Actinomycetota bacterium]MDP2289031.1 hypothetical protein [Actinomycetota bacterium]
MSTNSGAPHEDAVWNAIVADLSADPNLSRHIYPAPAIPEPAAVEPESADQDSDQVNLEDSPDDFVPPDPGPIHLASDAFARFAWAGALGGPAFLMLANIFNWGSFLSGIGVLAGVGGFVALIARHRDDRDDDFTDGAVV